MKKITLIISILWVTLSVSAQNRLYVTESGNGDGSSWMTASGSIQAMVDLLENTGGEVWVAAGAYYGDGVSQNAFVIKSGVNVYGGFAGNEPANYDLNLRNFELNSSVLDGQNLQRVLRQLAEFPSNAQATWDGFTIQRGFTNASNPSGPGAYLRSNVHLKNCIIQNNVNTAGTQTLGTVYILATNGNFSTMTNCKVSNNTTNGYGGGIRAHYAKIRNCEVSYNTTTGEGGGIDAYSTDIINCNIHHNSESYGFAGGVRMYEYSNMINSVVHNNISNGTGGGVRAIYSGNSIINCNIVNNVARSSAGGIALGSNVVITNTIIWGNTLQNGTPNQFSGSSSNITYSAIEGTLYSGTGNIILAEENDGNNPLSHYVRFIDVENQDYRLSDSSACINKGSNSAVTELFDILGNPRVAHGFVDMGAYEYDGEIPGAQLPLAGIYTINNTLATQNRNFNTFEEAIGTLNSIGISDSVVFEVISGQVYYIFLTDYRGLWITYGGIADKPITFRKTGAGANPRLRVAGTSNSGTNGDACFYLQYANNIIFDGLDIENAGTSSSNYLERGFVLDNSSHIKIMNCNIQLRNNSYNYAVHTLNTVNNLQVKNVDIRNVETGFYLQGSINTFHAENVNIRNASYGYYSTTSSTGITITKNDIDNVSNYGIYRTGTSPNFKLTDTKITNANRVGVHLGGGNNQHIYNNVVQATSTGISLGHSSNTDTVHVAHNTVYMTTSSSYSWDVYCLQKSNTNGRFGLYNNIFVNKSSNSNPRCITNSGSDNNNILLGSNHNIYHCEHGAIYSNSSVIINTVSELVELLGDGRESNSWQEEPKFISTVLPYNFDIQSTISTKVESGGQLLDWVSTDINGNPRFGADNYTGTGTAPDIGAYEFEGLRDTTNLSPLHGVYTINNTLPTQARNFNSFQDAINTLNTQGISDSVAFEVIAGQIHNIALTHNNGLRIIIGGTTDKPITFRKTGTGANPRLRVTGTSNTDICFFLDRVSYITFDGLDIENAGTSGSNYLEQAFYLDNTSNIKIINCNILLRNTTSNYAITTANTTNNLHVENVSMRNVQRGFQLGGSANTFHAENISIKNCAYGYNFSNSASTGITIIKNDIDTVSQYGINRSGTSPNFKLTDTKITNVTGTGVYIGGGNNQRIYNNVVQATSTGIYLTHSSNTDTVYVAHNTVYMTGTAANAYCLQKSSTNGVFGLYNNIFINKATPSSSRCFYNNVTSTNNNILLGSNNNIYYCEYGYIYSNSTANINSVAEYAELLGNGRESNSYQEEAPFVSTVNPYNFDIQSNKSTKAESGGQLLNWVLSDINGTPRFGNPNYTGSGTAPDIGAYEFEGLRDTVVLTPLHGVYTIDNTLPTQARNFNTFEEAINMLNTQGISDSVVFEAISGQIHHITLTNSAGLRIITSGSAEKPITFRKSGSGANPLLKITGTLNSSSDICFYLDWVNYITFDGIDVENAGTSAVWNNNNQLEYAFYLATADNITIANCHIRLAQTYTSYGIYATGSVNRLFAENVTIKNASYGYCFANNSSNNSTDNTISKTWIDSVGYGIHCSTGGYSQHNFTIKESQIYNATSRGITLDYGRNQKVYNNVVHARSNGLYLSRFAATDTVYIAHNTVYMLPTNTSSTVYCLYRGSSNGRLGLYNNIFINKSSNTNSRCFSNPASNNNNILLGSNNNIYYNEGGAIYSNSSVIINTVSELVELLGDGRESNSVQTDVPFVSVTYPYNLDIQSNEPTKVESGGQLLNWVSTDINGNPRFGNPNYTGTGIAPDIGAYEFEGIRDMEDYSPLSGVYTIDNTLPTEERNFNSFEEAIYALNNRGISDTVAFETLPGQVHHITLANNNGLILSAGGTAEKPIIFRKADENGGNTVLKVTGTSNNSDICFHLNRVNYITFNGFDIENAGISSTNYLEQAFYLNNTSNISILNCSIRLRNSSNNYAIYTNGNVSELYTENITIQDAHSGYYITGNTNAGITIVKNSIDNVHYGINMNYTVNDFTLTETKITNATYGIDLTYGNNQRIYNNVIHATTRGITCYGRTTDTLHIAHNTVFIPATTSTTYGLHKTSNGKVVMFNNIFINHSTNNNSRCIHCSNLDHILPESNNNLYYKANGYVYYYSSSSFARTIEEYKILLGDERESASGEENVAFMSTVYPFNFDVQSNIPTKVESGGKVVPWILTDIDGKPRVGNPNYTGTGVAPDIGAYEIEGSLIFAQSICSGDSTAVVNFPAFFQGGSVIWEITTLPVHTTGYVSSGAGSLPKMKLINISNQTDTLVYTATSGNNSIEYIFTILPQLQAGNFSDFMQPAHNTDVMNIPVMFSWQSLEGANLYDLYIWREGQPCPAQPTKANLHTLQYTHSAGLSYGNSYKWKIIAKNVCSEIESDSLTFTTRTLPNLHVTGITATEVDSITRQFTVSWQVKNDGTGIAAETWKDRIWLVPTIQSGTAAPNTIKLSEVNSLQTLAAGESYTNSLNLTLPGRFYGNYFILVSADMERVTNIQWASTGYQTPPVPYTPSITGIPYPYVFAYAYNKFVIEQNESYSSSDNFFYIPLQIPRPPIDQMILTSVEQINHKNTSIGLSDSVLLTVTTQDLAAPISITLQGEDAASFSFTYQNNWNAMTGGGLRVYFNPTEIRDYTATILLTSGNAYTPVVLRGKGVQPTDFNVTAWIEHSLYTDEDTVTIRGNAIYTNNTIAANEYVGVTVEVLGYKRVYSAKTNALGEYTIHFIPTKGEVGRYKITAAKFNVSSNIVKAEFDIPGMKAASSYLNWDLELGVEKSGTLGITNRSGYPLHNVRFETISGLPHADFTFGTIATLNGSATMQMPYTVTGTDLTSGSNWEEIKLRAVCDEGVSFNFNVYFYCKPAKGILEVNPKRLSATMSKGKSQIIEFDLYNNGNGETGKINVKIPNVDWMSLATPDTLPSVPAGDTARFSLRLRPTENTPLNVMFNGNISISCQNGNNVNLPFDIKAVSDSTGTLEVDVVDEYFYNTAEAPHLANAHVYLKHPYSQQIVAEGYTGVDGRFTVELPEGYYTLFVEADKHTNYRADIVIQAGETNSQFIFIAFKAITYTWVVVPTEIEDHYEISLITTFETNVPLPVVTIDVPSMLPDLEEEGEEYTFYAVVTNRGLIAARGVNIDVPSTYRGYEFIPLIETIDSLPAHTAVVVPILMRKPVQSSSSHPMLASGSNDCTVFQIGGLYFYYCGDDSKWHLFMSIPIKFPTTAACPGLGTGGYGWLGGLGGGGSYGGGGGGAGGGSYCSTCNPPVIIKDPDETCTPCSQTIILALIDCLPGGCVVTGSASAVYGLVTGKTNFVQGVSGFVTSMVTCVAGEALEALTGLKMPGCVEGVIDAIRQCTKVEYHGANSSSSGSAITTAETNNEPFLIYPNPFADGQLVFAVTEDSEPLIPQLLNAASSNTNPFLSILENYELIGEFFDVITNVLYAILPAETWGEIENISVFFNLFVENLNEAGLINENDLEYLISQNTNPKITEEAIRNFAERWNRTVFYWDEGYYTVEDLPLGYNPDFISIDAFVIDSLAMIQETCLSKGYTDIADMFETSNSYLEEYFSHGKSSVCASVTIQIDQKLTMTREAFRGTLTINNGHDFEPMQNISLNLEVTDEAGVNCTHLFHIETERLVNMSGISGNGTLNANSEGSAVILFIPTVNAAPTEPKSYSFGGTLSYLDPFTETQVTANLFPVTLEVHPSPFLHLYYFMQRDIFGDDPLTEDVVEPSIPAELAVMIHNKGYGTAKNVNIESAQPKIIDNEKGLLIDFMIIGSNLNGQERQLGVTDINFGNIAPHSQTIGQWWFTSSLLGHFTSYEARVRHLDSRGNPDLSLIDTVEIHELIRSITAYGDLDDGMPDFLVNDILDPYDYPDAIYFSNATKTSVVVADSAYTSYNPTEQNPTTSLNVKPSAIGWNYARLDDPGNGSFELINVTREDGQEIPITNLWLTHCTLPDGGEPIYENKLHFVDTFSTVGLVNYTLVFKMKNLNPLRVDSITGVPNEIIFEPLERVKVHFNKSIQESTFSYQDMELHVQAGPNLMDPTVTTTKINDSTFYVNFGNKTQYFGYYVFTVHTNNIYDMDGETGVFGKQVSWIQIVTPVDTTIFETICEGDTYDFNGKILSESGTYRDTIPVSSGRDSIVQLVLTVNPTYNIPTSAAICEGDSYTFYGQTLTTAGVYTHTLTTVHGCDSIIEFTLTVTPVHTVPIFHSICEGNSYTFYGQTLTTAGVYTHTLTTIHGCDSIIALTLTVNPVHTVPIAHSICEGDTYTFYGQTLTTAGVYTHTLTTIHGCDSIIELILTVNPIPIIDLGGDIELEINESITLSVAPIYHSYLWSTGETTSEITVTREVLDSDTSKVWVLVTTTEGCTGSDTISIIFKVGIDIYNQAEHFKLFPNPSNGKFYIEFDEPKKRDIQIFDLIGRSILKGSFTESKIELNLQHTGIYMIDINNNIRTKVIITK